MSEYGITLPHVAVSTEFITRDYEDIVFGAIVGETPTDDILLCAGRAFRLLSSKLGVSLKEEEDEEEEITFTDFTLADEPAERDVYATDEDFTITAGCYDAFSGDIFIREGYSLLRLRSDGSVEPLAGLRATPGRAEGKGLSARFETLGGVASDGVGSLYVEDDKRIRRVQLPAEWRRGAPRDHGSGSATPAVTVSTLHTSADRVDALAYDGTTDSLVFASDTKLFRLPLRRAAAAAANGAAGVGAGAGPVANGAAGGRAGGRSRNSSGSGRSGAAAAAARLEPQLIAGGGHSSSGAAPKDFEDPLSIAVDGDGNIFVLDRAADDDDDENIDCCIKVIRGGGGIAAAAAASTSAGAGPGAAAPALCAEEEAGGLFDQLDEDGVLVSGIPVDTYMFSACMTVLRNGSLVVACPNDLVALWLGLKPTLLRPRVSAPAAAPPRSLASDLGALLESPPDATSDLTLCVGGRKFAVHRAILAARCDYFRQRLAADTFADGAAAELELPDADADAFALLLRWLYTGAVELPAAAGQLQFIAELADRLLLPDLSAAATHKLLAAVTPATVVDAMLWAERQGEAGAALLAQLKGWYLEHDEQVVATARDSLKRLAVASPDLMVELHVAKKKRPRAT